MSFFANFKTEKNTYSQLLKYYQMNFSVLHRPFKFVVYILFLSVNKVLAQVPNHVVYVKDWKEKAFTVPINILFSGDSVKVSDGQVFVDYSKEQNMESANHSNKNLTIYNGNYLEKPLLINYLILPNT